MTYLEWWTGTSLEDKEESTVIKAEIDSISPHQVDAIEGRGMGTVSLEPLQLPVDKTFTVTLERL